MFRKSHDLLLLGVLFLATACSSGGGSGESGGASTLPDSVLFPSFLAEDFDSLETQRWGIERIGDVATPVVDQGRLRFRWDGAGVGSRVRLVLKRDGAYDAAALDVPVLDTNVEARITIELSADGQARKAFVGLRGSVQRIVEGVVEDEGGSVIERESTRLSQLEVPPGASDERIRFEVDSARETVRFFFANELFFSYTEPGLSVPDSSRIAIEVEARETQDTAIERFEAARLSEVPERRLTDVRPNHATPSRVQWLFKLREAGGDVLLLDPEEAESLVPRVFEFGVPIDTSETCPVIRTFEALPLQVAIVLDHTLSMEAFGGIEAMKKSARTLVDVIADAHTFSIWEFHDNQQEDGFSQLLAPGGTRAQGKQVIQNFEPELRGFSLCWDTVEEALRTDFPEDDPAAGLRVLVFFSDGVDTSSAATPDDLIDEAEDRGVIFYSLAYGQLTLDSRTSLIELSTGTNGLFAEAPTPREIFPEFRRLIEELSGYLQLAYVTGRFLEPRIESLASLEYEGKSAQQFIRGLVDGEEISFDEGGQQYDPQVGVLDLSGPFLEEDGDEQRLELLLSAVHVPRETREFELSVRMFVMEGGDEVAIPLDGPLQAEVDVEPHGPFDGWTGMADGQVFRFDGVEACFGDFGPLLRVRIRGDELPAAFRVELEVDNGIYDDLLRFAGSSDGDGLDLEGNWVANVEVGP